MTTPRYPRGVKFDGDCHIIRHSVILPGVFDILNKTTYTFVDVLGCSNDACGTLVDWMRQGVGSDGTVRCHLCGTTNIAARRRS